jgi:hypothetical protein
VGGWLCRNSMTGNRLEVGLGYSGMLAVEKAKGRMGNIGDGGPIAWCG